MGKPKLSDRRLRSTIIVVAEETKLFVKPNDPIRICSGFAMTRKRALKRAVGRMGAMRIMATNYTEIYIVGNNDGRIGRKYAILSATT